MKAVNLTPAEHRGSAGAGGPVYGLLGALALMVLLAGFYANTTKSIRETRGQVASVKAQADAAEAKTTRLKPYGDFASMRKQRTDTVTQLATTRFDWAHTLNEVARTVPSDTSLSELHGKTGTGASAQGAPTPPSQAGAAGVAAGPTVDISGCTGGQAATARLMVALRRIDGVAEVTLATSQVAAASSAASGSSAASSSGCAGKSSQFSMTLKFRAPAAAVPPTAAPASTGSTP
jgi:Tfp pilus assembly protein PilN